MQPNRIEPPQKTFFFERHDGSIITTNEAEAWRIINGRIQTYIRKPAPKLVGVSNGEKYYRAVIESHELARVDPVTGVLSLENKEKALQRLRDGWKEEFEAAKGHIEHPRNFDTVDKNGQPTKL